MCIHFQTEDILPRDQEAMRIAAEFVADRTQIERAAKYIKDILGTSINEIYDHWRLTLSMHYIQSTS